MSSWIQPSADTVEPCARSRIQRDNVQVAAAAATAPGLNQLMIPELLEPTMVDGVARFDLIIAEASHDFGSGTMADTISYNDQSILGPTLRWTSGDDVELHVTNNLDKGSTAHWHGADVPADDDGGPHSRIDPGQTWIADFAVIQPAATLWYHPHMMGTSAEQVYHGAAGMIIVDDDNPAAANLPSTHGIDDIPVILQDREFAADGQLSFEIDNDDNGDLNPDLTVNGTFDPYTTVPAGPVRLRLLNGSQARIDQTVNFGDTERWTIPSRTASTPSTCTRCSSRSCRSTANRHHPKTPAGKAPSWSPRTARS